jgi:hypothetical protein
MYNQQKYKYMFCMTLMKAPEQPYPIMCRVPLNPANEDEEIETYLSTVLDANNDDHNEALT